MKKIFNSAINAIFFISIFSSLSVILGCGSTESISTQTEVIKDEKPVIENKEELQPEVKEEVLKEEPEVVEIKLEDKEYQRSTTNVAITKETFVEDKMRILQIINDLDTYMKNGDFKGWTKYLAPESYVYWTKKTNLTKAAQRLPKKGLKLTTIEDYFKFVFVPARRGHTVDEIRYDTATEVNVVQVDDDKDIVYYSFKKIDGKWKLFLPKNPN